MQLAAYPFGKPFGAAFRAAFVLDAGCAPGLSGPRGASPIVETIVVHFRTVLDTKVRRLWRTNIGDESLGLNHHDRSPLHDHAAKLICSRMLVVELHFTLQQHRIFEGCQSVPKCAKGLGFLKLKSSWHSSPKYLCTQCSFTVEALYKAGAPNLHESSWLAHHT
jgi:hypothetical protein